MDIREPILVGKKMSGGSRLAEWLQGLGCAYHITASFQEARSTLLETRRFDVVLSETDVSDGNAYGLISAVTRSPTSLFLLSGRGG